MAISKTLIELNDATVAFLQSGEDLPKALESSILALSYNRTFLEGETVSSQSNSSLDECMLLSATGSDPSTAVKSGTFIYDHAVIIPTTIEIDATIVTAILVFNAALANHELAESNRLYHGTRVRLLTRAKHLYQLAYISCDLEQNPLFQFALINNIAVIEREIGNVSTANECFAYLFSLLIVFVDQGYDLRLRLVHGFVANVPFSIKNAAPAA
ncbi:unnamed protein product [Cylindrotheca closterium]|uniref:Uncharacterized protein n=1 Tax=Cylindrotheca closterium TaxID=2856 RepID=A0AAD2CJ02_9STRA|nr:unnamed protein product [Cylindrotheca closterium]